MDDGVRAFVAVRLAPEVEAAVERFQSSLRGLGSEISWTRPAGFHLTLRFLGNRVPAGVVQRMIEGLRPIAAATAPIAVQARGAGAFPSLNRPRVIWIGLASGGLGEVARQVEELGVSCGLEPEKRRFTPHLTIGRVRNPSRNPALREALEAAAARDFGACAIASMTLYRSHLSPKGASYEALATLAFENLGPGPSTERKVG
jgi:RNA 2',3'-cyclic 3'-phosphodiesterase